MEIIRLSLPSPKSLRGELELCREALRWLGIVKLQDRAGERVASLSYGHRKLVELVRAAAGRPVLLLLDEAVAGLTDAEKQEFKALIRGLRDAGVAILLVEHDMDFVMELSDEVIVMNFGRKIAEGVAAAVQNDEEVLAAYLGV